MTPAEVKEAIVVGTSLYAAVLASVPGSLQGASAYELRRQIGVAITGLEADIRAATLGTTLVAVFDRAVRAGATLIGMDTLRMQMAALTPDGDPAKAAARAGARLGLGSMVRILSVTAFDNRQAADAALDRISAGFETAEVKAADEFDSEMYRLLITARAACVRDIADRAQLLPRVTNYETPTHMPALALANFLYGDGGRSAELIAENKPVHPAFMPRTGIALAD